MKSIDRQITNQKNLLAVLVSLICINCYGLRVTGEILKNNNDIDDINFESILNQNSVQFHEYENPENLFVDFFGLGNPLNESSLNANFQDLSLQIDSKNVREIYIEKLLEMKKKTNRKENNQLNWSFFNKQI